MSLLGAFSRRKGDADAPSWGEITSRLARAVLLLVKAEASSLGGDLGNGIVVLRRAAVWLAITVFGGLLAGVALLTAAIVGLSQLLPLWAAALCVGVVLGLFAGASIWKLRQVTGELESPARTIQRRVSNHADWWQNELASIARPDKDDS